MRSVLVSCLLLLSILPATARADDNGLHQVAALGDLSMEAWLAPGVYRPTAVELHLADANGHAPTDVRRVDLQFAMTGMNHGARGIEADRVEPGVYQAAGYLLAMPGAWWMSVRVERTDGRLLQVRSAFVTPPEPVTTAAFALDSRPDAGVRVYDVVASPGELIPDRLAVTAGYPVRIESIYVDNPGCGPVVRVDDPLVQADVTSDGLAELTFTPTISGELRLTCAPSGLLLGR